MTDPTTPPARVTPIQADREALKPCPFCGEEAKLEHSYHEDDDRYPRDFWHVRVCCQTCDVRRPDWTSYGNQEQRVANFHVKQAAEASAITAWNTRAALSEREQAVLEALERLGSMEAFTTLCAIPNTEAGDELRARIDFARAAVAAAKTTYGDGSLREACTGIDDDYMTSEQHHPGYVLIPAAKFEAIRAALAAPKAEDTCPTCGDPSNVWCSDGFHAPGETYWPSPKAEDHPVAGEGVSAADAFEMGFQWARCLVGQNVEDSRAVGRTLLSDVFDPIRDRVQAELDERGFDSFKFADHGIAEAKNIIRAALAHPAPDALAEMRERTLEEAAKVADRVYDTLKATEAAEGRVAAHGIATAIRSLLATEGR